MADLPCDVDGVCMVCKVKPPDANVLLCGSCSSPWHMQCLNPPLLLVPLGDWDCPDCSLPAMPTMPATIASPSKGALQQTAVADMVGKIRAIQADESLSEAEKARKRQELMSQGSGSEKNGKNSLKNSSAKDGHVEKRSSTLDIFDQNLNCIFCMKLADRPTPCGHNFCLKCFERWVGQGKKNCGKCRASIPEKMASQPRINSALVMAIRMAKATVTSSSHNGPPKVYHYLQNENRPDKAFTTDRAVKTGKANACSGRIFVTAPPDHFGPIKAENDPIRGQGVLVGESWEDRMECRQWGVHLPHVAGIAGQSDYGAQSVALSGGYEDDEDHGEWFLYTGSGGRDLSGNKRTSKEQSFDQKFDKMNEALRMSCKKGYPVRVVRSHKEKRSSYAPEKGVRYDGVYRIEKCWRKKGIQGYKVCRYLFVRCDNEPAPWTSDEHGDLPRQLPKIDELKSAVDITERKIEPAWSWKEEEGMWGWTKMPPSSRKVNGGGEKSQRKKQLTIGRRLLKEFGCSLCKKLLKLPISTPCGHNFCKSCLEACFAGQQDIRERTGVGGRSLRVQKVMKRCPSCKGDITDFLVHPQVNRQMVDIIESLLNEEGMDTEIEHTLESKEQNDEQEESGRKMHKDEEPVRGVVRAPDTQLVDELQDLDQNASRDPKKSGKSSKGGQKESTPIAETCKGKLQRLKTKHVDGQAICSIKLSASPGKLYINSSTIEQLGSPKSAPLKCVEENDSKDEDSDFQVVSRKRPHGKIVHVSPSRRILPRRCRNENPVPEKNTKIFIDVENSSDSD
ncbi:hypothetical protein O6H91_09G095800 [Diphasiastrum complanatum]|uniref:Uncharacterized protein n=1 Tax=Diphasiastrum complanatum TaxID=34168 RepID=A0ACC2CS26_DIPCM|nr:hypothetical protein O6H91_09G095800 [Diphasiastrum complanatum]